MVGAADFVVTRAALHTNVGFLIALQAGIVAALAVVAASALNADGAIRRVADPMSGIATTRRQIGGTAQLLAITGAKAAGVVTALRMPCLPRIRIAGQSGAAIGPALVRSWGWRNFTHALIAIPGLLAGTFDRFGSRCWTSGGIGIALQHGGADYRRATQPEDAFQHRASISPLGQRLDQ